MSNWRTLEMSIQAFRCKYKSVIIIMVFTKPLSTTKVNSQGSVWWWPGRCVAALITYLLIKYSVATANPRPSQHSLWPWHPWPVSIYQHRSCADTTAAVMITTNICILLLLPLGQVLAQTTGGRKIFSVTVPQKNFWFIKILSMYLKIFQN